MDYLIKALAYNDQVRAYAIRTTDTVSEAQRRHQTWPTASAALGRAMTAGVMLGSMLKGDAKLTIKIEGGGPIGAILVDSNSNGPPPSIFIVMLGSMLKGDAKLTIKIEGGGPIGAILVDSNSNGEVRGYVTNPQTHFELNAKGKLDVARAVGTEGMLTIVKDLGLKDHFSGQVPILSGELGEDFTYYLVTSEQVPSSVGVGVLVNPDNTILASGGFIIQLLPGTDDETITKIEERLSKIEPISKMIQRGLTPEEILEEVLGEGNVKILEKQPVAFQCQCSKERIENAIVSLGAKEIQSMIDEDGQAEAQCHFCNELYMLTREDLEGLLTEAE